MTTPYNAWSMGRRGSRMTGEERPLPRLGIRRSTCRPGSTTAATVTRSARSPAPGCARRGPRRSSLMLRPRSAPASPAGPTRGSDRHPHRRGTPRAARTRQTGTTPSVGLLPMSASPHTPKIPPMAPTPPEPRRLPPNPTTPRDAHAPTVGQAPAVHGAAGAGWSIGAAAREVGASRTAGNNWARGYKFSATVLVRFGAGRAQAFLACDPRTPTASDGFSP